MNIEFNAFVVYDLFVGVFAAAGLVYLFYIQRYVIEYQDFLYFLLAGFLVFSIGGPLAELFIPNWSHAVHGVAALFVILALYNPVHNDLRKDEWAKLVLQDPAWIRHPAEWMTPMDDRVLELFHTSDLVLTPAIIAYNIDYSRGEVNRRLAELETHGFVEKVERGKYRLTEQGEQYLQGR
jgi:biotin operon repressor